MGLKNTVANPIGFWLAWPGVLVSSRPGPAKQKETAVVVEAQQTPFIVEQIKIDGRADGALRCLNEVGPN